MPACRIRPRLAGLALIVVGALIPAVSAAAELVMFEARGCPYCARWNSEIAPLYAKTPEGQRAPLQRVDVAAPRPPDLAGLAPVVYTPTFVLVADGREIGRIVGYVGEAMFWWRLGEIIATLDRALPPER